jgi:hypothetical protein
MGHQGICRSVESKAQEEARRDEPEAQEEARQVESEL